MRLNLSMDRAPASLLTIACFGGARDGFAGGGDERARFRLALALFIGRLGIGADACARLNMHHALLHPFRSQADAAVHRTIGREIADASPIRPASIPSNPRTGLPPLHLWRARN